jgi:hypothetical protein
LSAEISQEEMPELPNAFLLLSVIALTPGRQFEPHWLALQLV